MTCFFNKDNALDSLQDSRSSLITLRWTLQFVYFYRTKHKVTKHNFQKHLVIILVLCSFYRQTEISVKPVSFIFECPRRCYEPLEILTFHCITVNLTHHKMDICVSLVSPAVALVLPCLSQSSARIRAHLTVPYICMEPVGKSRYPIGW